MFDDLGFVELLPTASVVVDEEGCVLNINTAAGRLFGDCLRIGTRCVNDDCGFASVMEAVKRAATRIHQNARVALNIVGARPLNVVVYGLAVGEKRRFLMLLFSDDSPLSIDEAALTHLYDLTVAEARLVAALVGSDATPTELARSFSVSINTIRTHLKRIYSKIGVTGQSGLMRKILSGPVFYMSGEQELTKERLSTRLTVR